MAEAERRVLLVGSMPFADEAAAMARALDLVGERLLLGLPDGEVGERSDRYPRGDRAAWVQTIMDLCEADAAHFDVQRATVRNADGFSKDYGSGPRLRPKLGPGAIRPHLNFRWAEFFEASYPTFRALREERGQPGLRFQVGLPTGIGMTFGMMSPVNAMRYARAFTGRMADEANRILDVAGPDEVVFQLEVPGDLALAYRLPGALTGWAVSGVTQLVEQVRPGAKFGVHLCFGDLNNEALIKAGSIAKAVRFTNVLAERWPETHDLSYVHFPLAEAADPPSLDPAYYAPLRRLALPEGVRLVAGFVHDRLDEDAHRRLLALVEEAAGRTVDVAASCGLGRRSPAEAERMMQVSAALSA